MRWIAYIIAGWVVVSFLVGALIGWYLTSRRNVAGQTEASPNAEEESEASEERAKRSA
jgi:hypothetical protein